MTPRHNPVESEIAAATPVRDSALSAAIDRATVQAEAADDPLVRAVFERLRDELLDRVPDR